MIIIIINKYKYIYICVLYVVPLEPALLSPFSVRVHNAWQPSLHGMHTMVLVNCALRRLTAMLGCLHGSLLWSSVSTHDIEVLQRSWVRLCSQKFLSFRLPFSPMAKQRQKKGEAALLDQAVHELLHA